MLFLLKMLLGYEFWAGLFVGVVLSSVIIKAFKWALSLAPWNK